MRTLEPAPRHALNPGNGQPAVGSFTGEVFDDTLAPLCRSRRRRLATEKRWLYACAASDELFAAIAVVDLGYASNTFAFVYRHGEGIIADESRVGPPLMGRVRRDETHHYRARFSHPLARVDARFRRDDPALVLRASMRDLELRLELDERDAPPAMTAIAPVEGGMVNLTEKRALMRVRGSVLARGRRFSLDGAQGGLDFTHGLLARETAWNWGFLMGHTKAGERIGLNLVEGFVGEPECVLFLGNELLPLAEGRFEYERDATHRPWRVRTADGSVDLTFTPGAVHREEQDLGLVSSRFLQPVGMFRGVIRAGGKTHEIENALGVVEDQRVRW